jgi:hypothetical protein
VLVSVELLVHVLAHDCTLVAIILEYLFNGSTFDMSELHDFGDVMGHSHVENDPMRIVRDSFASRHGGWSLLKLEEVG